MSGVFGILMIINHGRGLAQDVPYDLILGYVSKIIYLL